MIRTERLRLYPASWEQMDAMIASEQDEELKKAYTEMLEGCLRHPDQWDWYAIWMIEKTDGTHIGDLCFKGLREDGIAEIGYGILEEHRGQGYATEAVRAACRWAFQHEEVKLLEAETDAGNAASQRVLQKCGFRPNGIIGEEGPRFTRSRVWEEKKSMKFKGSLIVVKDCKKALKFYQDMFGFELIRDHDGNMELSGNLYLQEEKYWERFTGRRVIPQSNQTELYFEEPEIDSFVKKLERLYPDTEYVNRLMTHSWGQRVVRFYDPDGNLIEVGTPV